MADEAVRVDGLRELRKALGDMEKGAPRALNKALVKALEPVELVASVRTPRESGALQHSNKLVTRGAKVVFVNRLPYANTLHWGRKTLRGVPSVVQKRPWFTAALWQQREQVARIVVDEIERFVTSKAP